MAQVQLPGHGIQSVHRQSQPPCEAHYESYPTFPTPRSQPCLGPDLATLCLHGHRLYSEVWNDQPPLHTWLITQVLKLQSRNRSRRLVTPTFEPARSLVGKPALPGTGSTSAAAKPGETDRRDALSH